ncbi:hypothetical protein [Mesorhizobium sp.]|uniref:hypothetical protein n=2 Tax=Mesorhizobium sp. TaxID=1871066 RepID=UPI000FE4123C|nr:hypothetical protein [Mesorhizobium sp.]RWI35531.1 MAG: hypothetical protein EOR14_28940 [Mesorhizobium sp.]RWJ03467.1 MAG: hypothetical protein EOR24_32320 [Mesorhizobium sp.]RWJ66300.1 MAG: hypothetical protein EOR34_28195 [Mesorhizobium sp.]
MMKSRQEIERQIAERLVKDILAAGYALSVYDGEETTLKRSTDATAVLKAMFTTDEDYLMVHDIADGDGFQEKNFGYVWLIYGNGHDVISDCTTNLETVMQGATALAERLGA